VRGGIYDRVQVRRARRLHLPRPRLPQPLRLEAAGAPRYTESAIFIIRSKSFSAAYPWKLSFLGNRVDRATGTRSFTSFDSQVLAARRHARRRTPQGRRARCTLGAHLEDACRRDCAVCVLLVAVTVVYAYREKLTRLSTHKNKWPVNAFKYTFWASASAFGRLWPDGAALHHPGADLVPFAAVPVDLVAVPV
jgi:NosR/NirI family nitrous oxide reductase transcriptional regulator